MGGRRQSRWTEGVDSACAFAMARGKTWTLCSPKMTSCFNRVVCCYLTLR